MGGFLSVQSHQCSPIWYRNEVICYYRLAPYLHFTTCSSQICHLGDHAISHRELPFVVHDIIKTLGRGFFEHSRHPLLYTILIKGDLTVYSSQQWYSADLRLERALVQWLRITSCERTQWSVLPLTLLSCTPQYTQYQPLQDEIAYCHTYAYVCSTEGNVSFNENTHALLGMYVLVSFLTCLPLTYLHCDLGLMTRCSRILQIMVPPCQVHSLLS